MLFCLHGNSAATKHHHSESINKELAMWLTRRHSDHYHNHKHTEHKQTYGNSLSNQKTHIRQAVCMVLDLFYQHLTWPSYYSLYIEILCIVRRCVLELPVQNRQQRHLTRLTIVPEIRSNLPQTLWNGKQQNFCNMSCNNVRNASSLAQTWGNGTKSPSWVISHVTGQKCHFDYFITELQHCS